MTAPTKITIDPEATDQAPPVRELSVRVPFAIGEGQKYFWTHRWRQAENESREEMKRGEGLTFDSSDPRDVMRWLLASDSTDGDDGTD